MAWPGKGESTNIFQPHMASRQFSFSYDGEPVFEHVQQKVQHPSQSPFAEPFYVYVMGPYTAFDARKAYDGAGNLKSPYIEDPLFDENKHVNASNRATYEAALAEFCDRLRQDLGVCAFLASDIDSIPTIQRASGTADGMSVLDQSIAFAAISDAVAFIFTNAGLTTGVGAEVGAILSDFNLRLRNPEPERKPKERLRIFPQAGFSSASVDEVPFTYGVARSEFETADDLTAEIRTFVEGIRRAKNTGPLPIYKPY